jgi:hypothetical protein
MALRCMSTSLRYLDTAVNRLELSRERRHARVIALIDDRRAIVRPGQSAASPGGQALGDSGWRKRGEGIEHRHAERREVLEVARQDGQPMAPRGRRDDQVGQSGRLTLAAGVVG